MVWTAPPTWVPENVLTADELNTYLRDNLNELSPAKATTPGSIFVTDGFGIISERQPEGDFVSTSESTSSTNYTSLATEGPSVTVRTSSQAFIFLYAHMYNSAGNASWMNYDVTGATNDDAVGRNSTAMMYQWTGGQRMGITILYSGLRPGINTFTAKYRVSFNTDVGTFSDRRIAVLPL